MAELTTVPTVRLKKGCAKPIHGGHPWVFADAITRIDGTPVASGDEVRVVDDNDTCLGRGFLSPHSAIAVRLLTRADAPITEAIFTARIDEALRLRRNVLRLGNLATQATSVAPELNEKDQTRLDALNQQLTKIQTFAAQYGMDATEETVELRHRRETLLKNAGATTTAHSLVEKCPLTTAYRLINSEGDGLGGLIVDVYDDYLAVQIGTAGMERRLESILNILEDRLHPKAILDRSDARIRQLEKLDPPREAPLRGQAPETVYFVSEYGVEMICNLCSSHTQKTGLFLDQRENRRRFASFASGRNVLDVFSYTGGFALHAAKAGARSITLIESSGEALRLAHANFERHQIPDAELIAAKWSEGFKQLREAGRQFDLMALDPPKFAATKSQVSSALSAYRDLNIQAVRLLSPGGVLFTCSCSSNVSELDFERAIAAALRASERRAMLIERRYAGPDHPLPPGFDQGKYLKCLVLQVV
ncbi:MAG: class I SAM-dependent rRNA methyltransferase [Planctomycetota bacterium]